MPPKKKAIARPKEQKTLPQCPYGEECYRKNPVHFAEFSHPWREEEKEEKKDEKKEKKKKAVVANEEDEKVVVAKGKKQSKKAVVAKRSIEEDEKVVVAKGKKQSKKAVAAKRSIEEDEKVVVARGKKQSKVMESCYVGLAPMWLYRSGGKAKYFQQTEEADQDEAVLLLSETSAAHLAPQLQHGDIVDFGDYRGCGVYVAEPIDPLASDFFLWKSGEEMGYSLPLPFSDSPPGYYKDTEIHYVFRYPEFLPRDHWLWEEVEQRKKDPAYQATADWFEEIKPKKFPEGYVYFEDNLNGGMAWLSLQSYISQEFFDSTLFSKWKKRDEKKKGWLNRFTLLVCEMIFWKRLKVPKGVSAIIASYCCSPPFPKISGKKLPALKQKAKRRKKREDDDDSEFFDDD